MAFTGTCVVIMHEHRNHLIMRLENTFALTAAGFVVALSMTLAASLAEANLGLLQWGSLAMILFYCRNLFRLYEQGDVFAPENVACRRPIPRSLQSRRLRATE